MKGTNCKYSTRRNIDDLEVRTKQYLYNGFGNSKSSFEGQTKYLRLIWKCPVYYFKDVGRFLWSGGSNMKSIL